MPAFGDAPNMLLPLRHFFLRFFSNAQVKVRLRRKRCFKGAHANARPGGAGRALSIRSAPGARMDELHFRHFNGGRRLGGVIESHLDLCACRKAVHRHALGQHIS